MKLFDIFCFALFAGVASVYCDAEDSFIPASSDVDKRLRFDIGKKRHFDDKRLRFDIGRKRAWEGTDGGDYAQELVLGLADEGHEFDDETINKRLMYDINKRLRFDIGKRLRFDIGKRLGADHLKETTDTLIIGGVEIPVCAQEGNAGMSLCGFVPLGGRWWPICSDDCEELNEENSYD